MIRFEYVNSCITVFRERVFIFERTVLGIIVVATHDKILDRILGIAGIRSSVSVVAGIRRSVSRKSAESRTLRNTRVIIYGPPVVHINHHCVVIPRTR